MNTIEVAGSSLTGTHYISELAATGSPNQHLFPLTAQVNSKGYLEIGGCDVIDLVQQFGSPLYILDENTLRTACRQYRDAFKQYYPGNSQVLYGSKAWSCKAICAIVTNEGLGIDVMSGGELYTALQAGAKPEMIYFHGNNKSFAELKLAIESGCTIVIDNWLELHTLVDIAKEPASTQRTIQVMLRMNPGIEPHTHKHISTGQVDSKFGFDSNQIDEVFAFVKQNNSLSCTGLHIHLGSQIFELTAYQLLADVMIGWLSKSVDYGLSIKAINIGGGLGIRYTETNIPPSIKDWAKAISEYVVAACQERKMPLPTIMCEPGRSLIGNAGVTAYTLGSQKEIPEVRTYLAVDGGMSDNPRPITYQATNYAIIANRMNAPLTETITIVGKHCESGDILFKDVLLPKTQPNDILVALGTGAYNYSQSSNYNRVPRPAAILVSQGRAHLIIKRETYSDLIKHDYLPTHLQN